LLPTPPFTDEEKQTLADQVYRHVWSQSESGRFGAAA
jgi:type I restriction enzyme R subunit